MSTLLTFFGRGPYRLAKYTFPDGSDVMTEYFPAALASWRRDIDQIKVFLTDEARASHAQPFRTELQRFGRQDVIVSEISIPLGQTEAELWVIFDNIARQISERVIVDITHGLRHFQILTILCLSYLHFSKELQIPGVYYGAFDVGTDIAEGGKTVKVAPVYELSPFISLLSWIEGVNAFKRYGDAIVFGQLLAEIAEKSSATAEDIKSVGSGLRRLSRALMVNRVDEAIGILEAFYGLVRSAESNIRQQLSELSKPFDLVSEQVFRDYFGILQAEGKISRRLVLAEWYLQRNHIPLALTLLREIMVSRMIQAVEGSLETETDLNTRETAEEFLKKHEERRTELGKAWSELRHLRNNVAHCGIQRNSASTEKVIENSGKLLQQVKKVLSKDHLWYPIGG